MNGLLAMLLAVPSALLVPLTLGFDAALIPGIGLALLVLGVIGGMRAGNRRLWWFALSIVLSEAFVGAGGVVPGALSTEGSGAPVLIFGVAAANAAIVGPAPFGPPFTILCALSLASLVLGPFAAAAALRHGLE